MRETKAPERGNAPRPVVPLNSLPPYHPKAQQGADAALLRVAGFTVGLTGALEEAEHALDAAGLGNQARDVRKVIELHRLCTARLSAVVRALAEGTPWE